MTQAVLPTTLNPQLESCSHRAPLLLMLPTKHRLTLAEEISEYRTAIAPNPFVLGP